MKTIRHLIMLVALTLAVGCGGSHDSKGSGGKDDQPAPHAHDAAHGGTIIELGSDAHLEFVHDPKAGKVTIHFTGPDAQQPLEISKAPKLKMRTPDGQKILEMKSSSGKAASRFEIVDPSLATDPLDGRISVEINGKVYNPDIEEDAGHFHNPDGSHG